MNDSLRYQLVTDRMERLLADANAARAAGPGARRVRDAVAGLLVKAGLGLAPCKQALLTRIQAETKTA